VLQVGGGRAWRVRAHARAVQLNATKPGERKMVPAGTRLLTGNDGNEAPNIREPRSMSRTVLLRMVRVTAKRPGRYSSSGRMHLYRKSRLGRNVLGGSSN